MGSVYILDFGLFILKHVVWKRKHFHTGKKILGLVADDVNYEYHPKHTIQVSTNECNAF